MRAVRIPPAAHLGLFLAASVALALARGPLLYALAAASAVLALRPGPSRPGLLFLALGALLPLPGISLLFLLAGREATGAWGTGALWGLARMVPYTVRLAGLLLANLAILGSLSLPETLAVLRRLRVPEALVLVLTALAAFLPGTAREAARTLEVQRSRGLGWRRLLTPSGLLSLGVPLFLAQARRSCDLALSLEIRGLAPPEN